MRNKADIRQRYELSVCAQVPLHRGFDGLSERTALHVSAEMKRGSAQPGLARVRRLARCSKSAAIWVQRPWR